MKRKRKETGANLVGTEHVLVEDVHSDLDESRVSNPSIEGNRGAGTDQLRSKGEGKEREMRSSRSIVPSGDLSDLVSSDLSGNSVVGGRIVLDRDLSRHWLMEEREQRSARIDDEDRERGA